MVTDRALRTGMPKAGRREGRPSDARAIRAGPAYQPRGYRPVGTHTGRRGNHPRPPGADPSRRVRNRPELPAGYRQAMHRRGASVPSSRPKRPRRDVAIRRRVRVRLLRAQGVDTLAGGSIRPHSTTASSGGCGPPTRSRGLSVLHLRGTKGVSTHPFYWAAFVAAGDWR